MQKQGRLKIECNQDIESQSIRNLRDKDTTKR